MGKNIVKENPIASGLVIGLLALLIGGLIALFIKMRNRKIESSELSEESFDYDNQEKSPLIAEELVKLDLNQSPTDFEKEKKVIKTSRVFSNGKGVSNNLHETANQLTQFNKIEEVENPFFDPEGVIEDYEYSDWNLEAGANLNNLLSQDFDNQSINSIISLNGYEKDPQQSLN